MKSIVLPKGKGHFYGGVFVDDWIYYSTYDENALFKKNIKTKEEVFVCRFQKYNQQSGVHENAFRIKNDLFFMPLGHAEKMIAVYHIETNSVDYIDLPKGRDYVLGRVACATIESEEAVWIIPCTYDAVLRVDKNSFEIKRFDDWPNEVLKHGIEKWKFYSASMYKDKIYMCPYDCPGIVEFDTETGKMKILPVEVEQNRYRKIISYEQKLYLFSENVEDEIVIFDLESKEVDREKVVFKDEGITGLYHAFACIDGKIIWMLPYEGNYIIRVDLEKKDIEKMHILVEGEEEKHNLKLHFWDVYETGNAALVTMGKASSPFLIIDKEGVHGDKIEITSQMLFQCMIDFINQIDRGTIHNENIGKKIYLNVKELIKGKDYEGN